MSRRQSKLSYKQVEEALTVSHGIMKLAADKLGVHRHTVEKFVQAHPEINEVRRQAEETLIDTAESHLVNNITSGDMKTIRWYLDRKGKERGYSQRIEQTGPNGAPMESVTKIEHVIIDPEKGEDSE